MLLMSKSPCFLRVTWDGHSNDTRRYTARIGSKGKGKIILTGTFDCHLDRFRRSVLFDEIIEKLNKQGYFVIN